MYSSASLETGKKLRNKAGSCGSDQGTALPPTSELCLAAILPSVGGWVELLWEDLDRRPSGHYRLQYMLRVPPTASGRSVGSLMTAECLYRMTTHSDKHTALFWSGLSHTSAVYDIACCSLHTCACGRRVSTPCAVVLDWAGGWRSMQQGNGTNSPSCHIVIHWVLGLR